MILNLDPGSADIKEIKRAYRRMALKYHPDAITSSGATEEERQIANDDFARINAAYAFLSGKSTDKPIYNTNKNSNKQQQRYPSTPGANPNPTGTTTTRTGVNSNSNNNNQRPRTSSHHQRTASHHQRVNVNMRDVTGFDINGNPRSTSASNQKADTSTHTKAKPKKNPFTSPHSANVNERANAQKHDFYSSARARARDLKNNAASPSKPRSPTTRTRAHARSQSRARTTNAAATSNPKWGRATSSTPASAFSSNSDPNRFHVKTHKRKHIHVNHATSKNNLGFARGNLVKIIGGSYSHRTGTITNMYPTMVKVAISPTMDVLVENKYVHHITEEELEATSDDRASDGTSGSVHDIRDSSSWTSSWKTTQSSSPNPPSADSLVDTTGTYSAGSTASHHGGSGSYSNAYSRAHGHGHGHGDQHDLNKGNWVEDIRGSNDHATNVNDNVNRNGNVNSNDSSTLSENNAADYSSSHGNHKHDIGSYSWTPSAETAPKKEDIYCAQNDEVQVNAHGHVHEHAHGNHHQVEVQSEMEDKSTTSFIEKSKWLLIPGGIVACVVLGVAEGVLPGVMLLGLDAVTSVIKSLKQ
jgi:curved DNA-binding protein CbpA